MKINVRLVAIILAVVITAGVVIQLILYFQRQAQFTPIVRTISTNTNDFVIRPDQTVITQARDGTIINSSTNSTLLNAPPSPISFGLDFFAIKNGAGQAYNVYPYQNTATPTKTVKASKFYFTDGNSYVYLSYNVNTASDFNIPKTGLNVGNMKASDRLVSEQTDAVDVYTFQNDTYFFSKLSGSTGNQFDITSLLLPNTLTPIIASTFTLSRQFGEAQLVSTGQDNPSGVIIIQSGQVTKYPLRTSVNFVIGYTQPYLTYLDKKVDSYEVIEEDTESKEKRVLTKITTPANIVKAQYLNGSYYLLLDNGELVEAKK